MTRAALLIFVLSPAGCVATLLFLALTLSGCAALSDLGRCAVQSARCN